MINTVDDALATKIQQMHLLSSMLPYEFGRSSIDFLEVTCASCSAELGPDTIRGTIVTVAGGKAAAMSAYGICYKCKTITPVVSKFHDDGTVLTKVGTGWVEDVWTTQKRGVLDDVFIFVRHRWQQIVPPVIAVVTVIGWIIFKVE